MASCMHVLNDAATSAQDPVNLRESPSVFAPSLLAWLELQLFGLKFDFRRS